MRPLLVSFFVFFLMLFGTNYVYQNWLENDSNLEYSANLAYSHTSQVVTLSAPSGKRLVPNGAVLGLNDVNYVDYSFKVTVKEGSSLSVDVKNVLFVNDIETYEALGALINFDIDIQSISATESVVNIRVSLNMPTNDDEYSVMKGSSVQFELVFSD